jgi:hypothetical protein
MGERTVTIGVQIGLRIISGFFLSLAKNWHYSQFQYVCHEGYSHSSVLGIRLQAHLQRELQVERQRSLYFVIFVTHRHLVLLLSVI